MDPYYEEKILEIKQYLDENFNKSLHCREILDRFDVNYQICTEMFRYMTGVSPKEYILQKRFDRLLDMLKEKSALDYACHYAFDLGFASNSAFYNFIKRKTGMTFSELRDAVRQSKNTGNLEFREFCEK